MSGPAPVGPLHAVLAELARGTTSLGAVAEATALPRDVVEAAAAHLVRLGRVSEPGLPAGCPTPGATAGDPGSGCGGCALRSLRPGHRCEAGVGLPAAEAPGSP